jgi:hypothetical protein
MLTPQPSVSGCSPGRAVQPEECCRRTNDPSSRLAAAEEQQQGRTSRITGEDDPNLGPATRPRPQLLEVMQVRSLQPVYKRTAQSWTSVTQRGNGLGNLGGRTERWRVLNPSPRSEAHATREQRHPRHQEFSHLSEQHARITNSPTTAPRPVVIHSIGLPPHLGQQAPHHEVRSLSGEANLSILSRDIAPCPPPWTPGCPSWRSKSAAQNRLFVILQTRAGTGIHVQSRRPPQAPSRSGAASPRRDEGCADLRLDKEFLPDHGNLCARGANWQTTGTETEAPCARKACCC